MMQPRDGFPALDPEARVGQAESMPIYDYRCGRCRHEFDQLVRGEEKVVCPSCQGEVLERLMSLTARPVSSTMQASSSPPIRPSGGGCCGGSCGSHSH